MRKLARRDFVLFFQRVKSQNMVYLVFVAVFSLPLHLREGTLPDPSFFGDSVVASPVQGRAATKFAVQKEQPFSMLASFRISIHVVCVCVGIFILIFLSICARRALAQVGGRAHGATPAERIAAQASRLPPCLLRSPVSLRGQAAQFCFFVEVAKCSRWSLLSAQLLVMPCFKPVAATLTNSISWNCCIL